MKNNNFLERKSVSYPKKQFDFFELKSEFTIKEEYIKALFEGKIYQTVPLYYFIILRIKSHIFVY